MKPVTTQDQGMAEMPEVETTPSIANKATTVALEALRLHVVWEALPQDRGGKHGPKGMALSRFILARDAALRMAGGA